MQIKDVEWRKETMCGGEDTIFFGKTDFGTISVLNRMTGWGDGIRDIETGFKDVNGKFWLASGMFDIREFPVLSVEQGIEKIKQCANTCTGQ